LDLELGTKKRVRIHPITPTRNQNYLELTFYYSCTRIDEMTRNLDKAVDKHTIRGCAEKENKFRSARNQWNAYIRLKLYNNRRF